MCKDLGTLEHEQLVTFSHLFMTCKCHFTLSPHQSTGTASRDCRGPTLTIGTTEGLYTHEV